MSNSTDSASNQFLTIEVSLSILLFTTLSIPAFVQGLLSIVALIRAQGIDWKMKVLMINILSPDLLNVVTGICYSALLPVRAFASSSNTFDKVTCFIGFMANLIRTHLLHRFLL